MGQPPTAGIIVAAIFGVLAATFFGYRLYRYFYWRGVRQSNSIIAPEERAPMYQIPSGGTQSWPTRPPPYRTQRSGPRSHMPRVGSLYGDVSQADGTRVSLAETGVSAQSPDLSGNGLLKRESEVGDNMSMPGSPRGEMGLDREVVSSPVESDGQSGSGAGRQRLMSSSSSTTTIQRSFTRSSSRPSSLHSASVFRGGPNSNFMSAASPGQERRRESYLPHLPENRDQIHIVPPQPLGFGLGGMAQAIDQRTLAFSKSSGVGEDNGEFSRDIIWMVQQGDEGATSAAIAQGIMTGEEAARLQEQGASLPKGSIPAPASSSLTAEERNRYLAQGPSRTLTPKERAQLHDHIYPNSQPNSTGQRTPEMRPSSRSNSPSAGAVGENGYASSGSDIGPSVSQRGAVAASAEPQQPENVNDVTVPVSQVEAAPPSGQEI